MKNAYSVLEQKEKELARVRQEVESLRIVAPLLSEEAPFDTPSNGIRMNRIDNARA